MSQFSASQPPLIAHLPGERSLAVKAAVAVIGSILLAISAKLQVPFYPVPVTMQTLVVLVLGFCSSRSNDCAQVRAAFGESSNEYQQCLRSTRSGGFRTGGGSFGGYSSGGGHK